jgi:1-deoxy-D-xylulose-5-phosphate reductoisomerase
MPRAERRVIILGASGSIGRQAIDVIEHLNALHDRGDDLPRTRIVGLATGSRGGALADLARRTHCTALALADAEAPIDPSTLPARASLRRGANAAESLVREVDADIVLAAMVGSAGLPATLAAVELGRDVALANKETLVAAGELVVAAARRSGSRLLPVDSEHSGLWQCLHGAHPGRTPVPPLAADAAIARVVLTASGGPFRGMALEEMRRATPAQALRHPTWTMGRKVTIDSASLMNKGLELIEAHWLFGLSADRLGVLIHPQSIVHALVEMADGSTLAHLAPPDMRGAIQHALLWPERAPGAHARLDWSRASRLEFEPHDPSRFPAPDLALRAIRAGGTSGAILNAANEAAVEGFLAGRLEFTSIAILVARALDSFPPRPLESLAHAREIERGARAFVEERLAGAGSAT